MMENAFHCYCDYIVHINFMRYNNRYVPKKVVFKSTTSNETWIVLPDPESLTNFTFEDMTKNLDLYKTYDFWELAVKQTKDKVLRTDVEEFQNFLYSDVYEKLKASHGRDVKIGVYDIATMIYLKNQVDLPAVFPLTKISKYNAEDIVHNEATDYKIEWEKEKKSFLKYKTEPFTNDSKVDFIAHIDFIRHKNHYVPKTLAFASTFNPSEIKVVLPHEETLTNFNFEDVAKNLNMYGIDLFWEGVIPVKETKDIYRVDKEYYFENYLKENFFNKLKEPHGWDVQIGVYDTATLIYLQDEVGFPNVYNLKDMDYFDAEEEARKEIKIYKENSNNDEFNPIDD